jgi:hypothetical protein
VTDAESTTATRTAALLVASPEYVYADLIEHRSSREWWEGHSDLDELDAALLARKDPLITLGVAETTKDFELLKKIYDLLVSDNLPFSAGATYKSGLRIACLSNTNEKGTLGLGDAADLIGSAEFERIVTKGDSVEVNALLRNPSFNKLIPQVLERKGVFSSIDDQRWCSLVRVAARNDRLSLDESDESGPDMHAWDIQRAIVRFACSVPVSILGARTLIPLLQLFHGHAFAESKSQHDVLFSRWQSWDYKKEERDSGWPEDLKSEVIALLGAVVYAYSTKDEKGKFGSVNVSSLTSDKLAERCGYYSIMQLDVPQMEAAYRRDREWFMESAIRNPGVMYNSAKRIFIEEHLPNFLNWYYKHHCDVYAKRRKDFSATPVTTDQRREFNLPEPATELAINAVMTKALALEASLEKLKRWLLWSVLGLAVLILWTAHRLL